ncbi:MAG: mechanosensitive ion channel family protein [Acidilobus sp.]
MIIGFIVAYGVAAVLRRALSLKFFAQYPDVQNLLGLSVGAVKAFIILVTLAIAFSVLKLGPATVYMQEIANYLPSLAGAIVLLTLGVALVNILVDYIQKQVGGGESPYMKSIFNILRFGLYAVIITIAVQLAIFYWIHFINPYLFYDIIMATVILVATLTITDTVVDQLLRVHPELKDVAGYGRFLLYLIFLLLAIAIIAQPFYNVTQIIYAFSWGLAIAFAIAVIPLAYLLVKRIAREL